MRPNWASSLGGQPSSAILPMFNLSLQEGFTWELLRWLLPAFFPACLHL